MKRLWMSKFKTEVWKYLKGSIVVKIEPSSLLPGTEVVKIVIYNDYFTEPFVHNIGSVDNLLGFDPIDVAHSFIRFYKEIIANIYFKSIDKN